MKATIKTTLFIALALIAAAFSLAGCGGASPSLNQRSNPVGPTVGMPVYIPYVMESRLKGVLTRGAVVEIEFTIALGSGAPENLYVHDDAVSPLRDWFYGSGDTLAVLWPLEWDTNPSLAGYVVYDNSGLVVHHLLMPEAGEYTLTYLSAVSLQTAGIYDLYGELDPVRIERRSVTIAVAP